jgi:hypothetical protein
MKASWWLPVGTCAAAVSAYAVMTYRVTTGGGGDASGATLSAAILFPPAAALCLAGFLARCRPVLATALLVGVVALSGLCVLGLTGEPFDPFALAGVWVIQWLAASAALVASLIGWLGGRMGR